jgi:hypothetical protein
VPAERVFDRTSDRVLPHPGTKIQRNLEQVFETCVRDR